MLFGEQFIFFILHVEYELNRIMYTAKKINTAQTLKNDKSLFSGPGRMPFALLSFLIPFFLIIIVYVVADISPFGDNSLILADASSLYISDLAYLSRLLQGKEDILYTFQQGIGMNAISVNGNLLNPANLIAVLFKLEDYAALYSLVMAIDMACCGLTMYLFLSNNVKRKVTNLIFSTAYALIGFNIANCFQYNFLLSVELLPLIAWGIMNILKGKKPWIYIISLACAVFSNSYLAYMLCIASVALFLMWYIKDRESYKPRWKSIFRNYILSSVVAGLLPAFCWVPGFLAISGGRLEQTTASEFSFKENMPILDFFAKFFVGANNTDELINGLPNVFCGTLALFLVIAYFIDRRNSKRAKCCYASILVFYFLTFYIKALSMAAQGFSTTNWFNYRYSYIFSFILLIIGCLEFNNIREIHKDDLKRAIIIFVLMVIAVFSKSYGFVSGGEMLINVVVLAVILGMFALGRKKTDDNSHKLIAMLLLAVCSCEMGLNYVISYNKLIEEDKWQVKSSEFKASLASEKSIIENIQETDNSFYRIGNEFILNGQCLNDPRLIGYNGFNYFGSCERVSVYQGLSKLGASWNANRIWYSIGEPKAFDSLLGIKYIVAWRDVTAEKDYQLIDGNEINSVYMNPYALPVSMVSTSDIGNVSLGNDPFANHNRIWKALSGIDEDVFSQEEDITFSIHSGIEAESITYKDAIAMQTTEEQSDSSSVQPAVTVQVPEDTSYIRCEFIARQDGAVYSYNGCFVDEKFGYTKETIKYLGTFKKGDLIVDYITLKNDFKTIDEFSLACSKYRVAYANEDVLADHSKVLNEGAGTIEKITDSHLTGTFSAADDSRIFFTIPYNEGWTLKIDGEITAIDMTADIFMSAPVSEGNHTFELTFFPNGMKTGMIVSGCSLVLLLILVILNRKRIKDK